MKKILLLIFCIVNIVGFAQECKYAVNKVDDFTGNKVLSLKPVRIATMDNGFYLRVDLNSNGDTIFFHIDISDKYGCASYDSYILIKLIDGNVIEIKNFGEVDCGERPSLYFQLKENEIELLKNSDIDKIRVSTTDALMDSRSIKVPNYFKEYLNCLI